MNESSIAYVALCCENEGFDYAINHYSDYKEVTNKEFIDLKNQYEDARAKLMEFLGVDE